MPFCSRICPFPLAAKQTVPVGFRLLELLFTLWNGINRLLPVHWEWWRCSQSALKAWKNWVVINIQFACVWGDRQGCKRAKPHVDLIVYLRNAAARMQGWPQFPPENWDHSVVPMHNLNQCPDRDTVRQTVAAESGKASISASRTAACHVVPCGLQNRLDKSEAFQNPEYLQEQAHYPIWQYFSLLEILVLKNLS